MIVFHQQIDIVFTGRVDVAATQWLSILGARLESWLGHSQWLPISDFRLLRSVASSKVYSRVSFREDNLTEMTASSARSAGMP